MIILNLLLLVVNKNALNVFLQKKKMYIIESQQPVGSGSSKSAFIVNDDFVILCPKLYNINHESFNFKINKELEMILYLESFSLPTIPNIQIVQASGRFGTSLALLQPYIKNASLHKPLSMPHFFISKQNLPTLLSIYNILQTEQIYISDLQLLINEHQLFIIDPSNIYNLKTFFYIGNHPRNKKHQDYSIAFINQQRILKYIIDLNSKKHENE